MISDFIFEQQWFSPLFKACREAGLDWRRMAAIALIQSNGDPSLRTIDWEYIFTYLNRDNPIYSQLWLDEEDYPTVEIIDRGTKWGLFQIHGERAIKAGYKGQILGLASVGANIKLAVSLMINKIKEIQDKAADLEKTNDRNKIVMAFNMIEELPANAEKIVFNIPPTVIDSVAKDIETQCNTIINLLDEE